MKLTLTAIAIFILISPSLHAQQTESRLETVDIRNGKRTQVFSAGIHFEAPNWSRDGKFFIVNHNGKLFRIPLSKPTFIPINTEFATQCNNDHGISPDGKMLVISHSNKDDTTHKEEWKKSTIYTLPIGGGQPKKITDKTPSFWHGWSPDGKTLAYCAERNGNFDIYTIPVEGGEETRLSDDPGLDDGPEYSHDGKYIYYNSYASGTMQIWRMHTDGSGKEQLTKDQYSNWFPHPSPDGKWIVFITYMEDQKQEHPFGKDVRLRLMNLKDKSIKNLTDVFFGGQGTLNVPSWSPDSRKLAFVSYSRIIPSSRP